MDFDTFKKRAGESGQKVGLLSKSAFAKTIAMIPDDEKVLWIGVTYATKINGVEGSIVVTENTFYGKIPQLDKSLQSLTISRAAIEDIIFPQGKEKMFKAKTTQGEVDIGNINEMPDKLAALRDLFNKSRNSAQIVITAPIPSSDAASSDSTYDTHVEESKTQSEVEEFYATYAAIKNAPPVETKARCPKCNSDNIQPLATTKGKTQGFGLGKAAIGGLALGPLGLAAGVIGMGKGKTTSEIVWVCSSCGNQFKKPKKA